MHFGYHLKLAIHVSPAAERGRQNHCLTLWAYVVLRPEIHLYTSRSFWSQLGGDTFLPPC
jgi:hypothetical protein